MMFGIGEGDDITLTMDKPRPSSLLDTGAQNVIGKPLGEVPYIERDAKHVSRAPCIMRVFDRAATAGAQTIRLW